MSDPGKGEKAALVVGVGQGSSASFARLLSPEGYRVALAERRSELAQALAPEMGGSAHVCDASDPERVAELFAQVAEPEVVLCNPSVRVRGPVAELDPEAVRKAIEVTAFGAFLVAQQAARRMLAAGHGTILLTGASAGVKGFARSAPFAMGKFALRGLAQSLSRELHLQGVHVAHVVVDGSIGPAKGGDGRRLDPEAIAAAMLGLVCQDRSCWTDELAVRSWVESF